MEEILAFLNALSVPEISKHFQGILSKKIHSLSIPSKKIGAKQTNGCLGFNISFRQYFCAYKAASQALGDRKESQNIPTSGNKVIILCTVFLSL